MRKLSMSELQRPDAATYAAQPKLPLVLVADNVRSMHNVGAFFRTADALNLHSLWLCGITATPPHRDIYKSALGAEHTVPWHYAQDVVQAVQDLKQAGHYIVILEQTDASMDIRAFVPPSDMPLALVVGNEVNGVTDALLPLADAALEIPQYGTKHSLNVSVAAGIALWHLGNLLR